MSAIKVFLRTPLFTTSSTNGHIPKGTFVLTGALIEQGRGGLLLAVEAYGAADGRPLKGTPQRVFLPLSKVDHALMPE